MKILGCENSRATFNITDHFLYIPAMANPQRAAILGEPAADDLRRIGELDQARFAGDFAGGNCAKRTRADCFAGLGRNLSPHFWESWRWARWPCL